MNQIPSSIIDNRYLYDIYQVSIHSVGKIIGGVPKNKDLIATWVKTRTGFDDEETAKQIADIEEYVEEKAERSWNGFLEERGKGIFLEARCVKALLRECATVLGITAKKRGSRQIIQHGFEIKAVDGGPKLFPTDRPRLGPDGMDEGAIHVMTAQGKRSALKRVDYIENASFTFQIWVLRTPPQETRHLGENDIRNMLALAQDNGLGSERSQGKGKFVVTEFLRLTDAPADPVPATEASPETPAPKAARRPRKAAAPAAEV